MNEEPGKKFDKSLEEYINEMRQMQQDLILGKVSNKEVNAKLAECKQVRKETKKVFDEMVKQVAEEECLKNK